MRRFRTQAVVIEYAVIGAARAVGGLYHIVRAARSRHSAS
jgi:hypothetical protein